MLRRLRQRSRSTSTQITYGQQDSSAAHQSVADLFDDLVSRAVASGAGQDAIATALDHATQAAAEALATNLRL